MMVIPGIDHLRKATVKIAHPSIKNAHNDLQQKNDNDLGFG